MTKEAGFDQFYDQMGGGSSLWSNRLCLTAADNQR